MAPTRITRLLGRSAVIHPSSLVRVADVDGISRDHVHDSVLVDHCDAGQLWDPVLSAYFYRLVDPITLKLARMLPPGSLATSNLTSFLYFSGLWGDFQYPDDHPDQKTVPYFGLKRYVSGPTGPTTKQLVRKGLSPDHPERKSWVQWGVHIFMSLYPCCLRGWRAWLSGMIFIVILVSIAYGVFMAVKRFRSMKMGYERVETGVDIPLNSLDYRDNIHAARHAQTD